MRCRAGAARVEPERSVEIIVTCQPGCGPDIAARTIRRIWQDHKIVQALDGLYVQLKALLTELDLAKGAGK